MKFSIIVPIYKVEKYLPQCVESVLGQGFSDFELILVDDGSPDKCPGMCDDYSRKDSRVKVIHKINGGLVSARKAGAEIAEGEYVIVLDGDDWIECDSLTKIAKVIESYSPDVIRFGFILSDGSKCKTKSSISSFRKGYYNRGQVEKDIMPYLVYGYNGCRFPHSICGACVKMDKYRDEQLSVDNKIKIGEDGVVMRPVVYNAQSVYVMEDCLYYYRRNMTSMTKNRKPFSMDNFIWIVEHYAQRMDLSKYGLQSQVDRSLVQNAFTASVTQFWQDESYFEIRKKILTYLNKKIIRRAIKDASYKFSLSRYMMLYVMKLRVIPVLWLYSKVKRF